MQKWEYKIVDSNEIHQQGFLKRKSRQVLEAHLNSLGEQGWEFIKVEFMPGPGLAFVGVAKRELQEKILRRNHLLRIK